MSKIAHYLQEHLVGEVSTSPDVRSQFSTDSSVLELVPSIVVYPRSENDVRKTARFCWQIAERGRVIPITARGAGSDLAGAALGAGIMMVFPAHMNKIISLDPRRELVELEVGINYDKLQQTLYTHGLFLPPYPASMQYATIGGAIANNASGEKSVKYGTTKDFIQRMRVVLSNGEVIETGRLSKRELNKKMGLSSFEGELYRALDALLDDNSELIKETASRIKTKRNSSGYNVFDVKRKDGSFDLTPLIVGSQGTLGIVTEALVKVVPHSPVNKIALVALSSIEQLQEVITKIKELDPSMLEFVNGALLEQIAQINPNQISGILQTPRAAAVLLVEFDDLKEGKQGKQIKKLQKLANKYHASCQVAEHQEDQENLLAIRRSVAVLMSYASGQKRMVPIAEDIAVPPERFAESVQQIETMYSAFDFPAAVWGQAGDGILRTQPLLDIKSIGDRQKLFKLSDEMYSYVIGLGGSISGGHGDGRMRSPYVAMQYGNDMYQLFAAIKQVFDPFGILNPGVKLGTDNDTVKQMMRSEYSLGHHLEHMPRT